MSADQVSALLFAAWVAAAVALGLWALWRLVCRDIDRATTLPDPRRPRPPHCPTCAVLDLTDPPTAEHPTELLSPINVHDLPRKGVDTWL